MTIVRAALAAAGILLSFAPGVHGFVASQPSRAIDYGVFGGGAVTFESYSTVLGHAYSGGDMTLEFGYGIQRDENLGDMYAGDNFSVGSLCEINGRVYVNGTASGISGATIAGGVTTGPSTVKSIPLPPATTFMPGTVDVIRNSDFTLSPGAYGRVETTGLFDKMFLSAGNYYLKSLVLDGSQEIHLNLSGGPINVFVEGDVYFDSGTDVFVNGISIGGGADSSVRSLASQVLFESHGNVTMGAGFLSYFFGTVFAPNGSVQMNTEEFYGSIISAGEVTAEVYLQHYPSQYLAAVPEPTGAAMAAAAGVALVCRRRAWLRT